MRNIRSLSALILLASCSACGTTTGTLEPPRPPSALVADLNPEPAIPDPVPAESLPAEQRAMCVPTAAGAVCYTSEQVGGLINALRNEVRVRGARFYGLREWVLAPTPETPSTR